MKVNPLSQDLVHFEHVNLVRAEHGFEVRVADDLPFVGGIL